MRSACHQRDRADVTEFVTLVRLSSLGQHVGVLALAGYKRRKSALTAGPIDRVKNGSGKWGPLPNAKKTKIMVIDQNWNAENDNFYVDCQQLDVVPSFEYLGSVINTKADCWQEIRRMLGMVRKVMMALDKIWKSRISISLKLRLVETSLPSRRLLI